MKLYMATFLCSIYLSIVSEAKTIYVPDDYAKIQEAIDTAVNSDTIIVRPGTYVENIDFLGKEITLTSEQGAEVTVINGNKQGSVVSFINNENSNCIINGFLITNGSSHSGGGIFCMDSSPTISDNHCCPKTA